MWDFKIYPKNCTLSSIADALWGTKSIFCASLLFYMGRLEFLP